MPDPAKYEFRNTGAVVSVRFEGEAFTLESNLLGTKYLAELLRQPHRAIPAKELRDAIAVLNGGRSDGLQFVIEDEEQQNLKADLKRYGENLKELMAEREQHTQDGSECPPDIAKGIDEESERIRQTRDRLNQITGLNGKQRKIARAPSGNQKRT